jgi:hypothetical protein
MLPVPPLPASRSAPELPLREQSEALVALEALTVPLLPAWPVPRSLETPLVPEALLVSKAPLVSEALEVLAEGQPSDML